MRSSYILPIHNGRITLVRELLDLLSIGESCVLYAVPSPADQSAILCTFPPSSWENAHRLVIYTAARPGSLARATEALSELGINLLVSWAAATSPHGELCLTSVVELPPTLRQSSRKDALAVIREDLATRDALSDSDLFSPEAGLSPVYLAPLSVLGALARRSLQQRPYELRAENWTLDLTDARTDGSPSLYDELASFTNRQDKSPATLALLTPDTEERYLRLALLPPAAAFRTISFPVTIRSEAGRFDGYFQAALEVLARRRLNVFSARNLLRAKTGQDSRRVPEELAEFTFTYEASQGGAESMQHGMIRDRLCSDIRQSLQRHAQGQNGEVVINLQDVVVTAPHTAWPRCFFATNAKPKSQQFEFACRVFRELVAMGLYPVDVDVTLRSTVREDVEALLGACPMLVALHLPEEKNEMSAQPGPPKRTMYCPSDWVIFEEVFMHGLARRVFRMRHNRVRQPAFYPGFREFVFDERSFKKETEALADAIKRHMQTADWRTSLSASIEAARGMDPALLERDLERHLCLSRRH